MYLRILTDAREARMVAEACHSIDCAFMMVFALALLLLALITGDPLVALYAAGFVAMSAVFGLWAKRTRRDIVEDNLIQGGQP